MKTNNQSKNVRTPGSSKSRNAKQEARKPYMPKWMSVRIPIEKKRGGLFTPIFVQQEMTRAQRRNVPKVPSKLIIKIGGGTKQDAFERAWGIAPLRAVLQKAVEVLNPNPVKDSSINGEWLAEMAIRAVAEAVIRQGGMPIPLKVHHLEFAGPEIGYGQKPLQNCQVAWRRSGP
jgi:hypothetical protein